MSRRLSKTEAAAYFVDRRGRLRLDDEVGVTELAEFLGRCKADARMFLSKAYFDGLIDREEVDVEKGRVPVYEYRKKDG